MQTRYIPRAPQTAFSTLISTLRVEQRAGLSLIQALMHKGSILISRTPQRPPLILQESASTTQPRPCKESRTCPTAPPTNTAMLHHAVESACQIYTYIRQNHRYENVSECTRSTEHGVDSATTLSSQHAVTDCGQKLNGGNQRD